MRDKINTRVLAADAAGLAEAAAILADGGIVAVPTETVYGLAARADSAEAVARIFAAKGRPSFNPLIVHVKSLARARQLAHFPPYAQALAGKHWPGPLTLVLERQATATLAPAVSAGLPTIALRVSAHPVMAALLERVPFELAAPSANRSGFISPTTPAHVLASLDGRIDLVLDHGAPCESGIESTILAVRADDSWEELRPGPLDPVQLAAAHALAREASAVPNARGIEAPGQLASHYAPGKPVRLDAITARAHEYHIGFGRVAGDCSLSPGGDLAEAASRLYAALHLAAADARPAIAVAPIPDQGIGRAINDRLRRAATPPE